MGLCDGNIERKLNINFFVGFGRLQFKAGLILDVTVFVVMIWVMEI